MADKAVSALTQVVNHAAIGNCFMVSQRGAGAGSTNSSLISALQIPYANLVNAYAGGSNAYGTRTVSSDRITPPVQTVHDMWYDVYPRTWTSTQSTVYVINESTPTTLIKAPMIYVKQNNIWKQVTEAWIKDSGTWKQFLYSPLPPAIYTARVLVIAAGGGSQDAPGYNCGGGGQNSVSTGGGGGGGVIAIPLINLTAGQAYTITVGTGGRGNGGNSSFPGYTAIGGGVGGTGYFTGNTFNVVNGSAGGSGGGGMARGCCNASAGGAGTAGQGSNGANGPSSNGGGGSYGGAGGGGSYSDITGSNLLYSRGGVGGAALTNNGNGSNGAFYGAGAGGAWQCGLNGAKPGASGAGGVVIIRVDSTAPTPTTTGTVSITTAGTDKVYTFTSNGTIRFN